MARRSWLLAGVAAFVAAGCGSQEDRELPPPATPRATLPSGAAVPSREASFAGGRYRVVLEPRLRVLRLVDPDDGRVLEEAPAGVGPAAVACLDRGPCYVTDTRGEALLVFSRDPELELVRRVHLPGSPWTIRLDPEARRLFVTLPDRGLEVEMASHRKPHPLRFAELPGRGGRGTPGR